MLAVEFDTAAAARPDSAGGPARGWGEAGDGRAARPGGLPPVTRPGRLLGRRLCTLPVSDNTGGPWRCHHSLTRVFAVCA